MVVSTFKSWVKEHGLFKVLFELLHPFNMLCFIDGFLHGRNKDIADWSCPLCPRSTKLRIINERLRIDRETVAS